MPSLKGHLLVASPHLPDANFLRSVVLIVHHTDEGAFGLVLNRPAAKSVQEIWSQISDAPCSSDRPLLLGGPVDGPLSVVHCEESCSESRILPGIFFAAAKENVEQVVTHSEQPFLLFSGYSGWGAGQLEGELQVGGWLTTLAERETIFCESDQGLWKTVTGRIGDDIIRSTLGIRGKPDDPLMN